MDSPNPLAAAWSMLRARFVRKPRPDGDGTVDHSQLDAVLAAVGSEGVAALTDRASELAAYVEKVAAVDPDTLTRNEALAYWINLYNALALDLARRAQEAGDPTVLRVDGAFTTKVTTVAGEDLSLDQIEHGKVRRFGDPRIHAALICGSTSCPTLRHQAYDGAHLGEQLDDQMRFLLAEGGAQADREEDVLRLSRVFLWFGADFVRPHRIPTILPARRRNIAEALTEWLEPEDAAWLEQEKPRIEFQPYDWSLRCAVRPPPS